ncbi:hypothetical protein ABTY98_01930 [Streptomyces sp. NPDC096040]|uniref:hypothetical protein n=1 Tax=Streptomyces sp. NPDC096040 TaxID=3155541 RepID=UPI0033178DD5
MKTPSATSPCSAATRAAAGSPAPNGGNILCASFDAGWLWYIPLRDDLTSVGAMIAPEHYPAVQNDPRTACRT